MATKTKKGGNKPQSRKSAQSSDNDDDVVTRARVSPEFSDVEADEVPATGSKSSEWDPMVEKCLEMSDGERFGVMVPDGIEPSNMHLRVSGVLRRRVKPHPSAEGYKFKAQISANREKIIVTCIELETD